MRRNGFVILVMGLLAVGVGNALADQPKSSLTPASDGRVTAGEYVEIDTEGRANRDFLIAVQEVTPNIVVLQGKNGWLAFVSFDAEKKEYRGFFEWPNIPGVGRPEGKWADLYQIKMTVKDGSLRIEGKSAKNELLIRAKPTAEIATPKAADSKK